MARSAEPLQRAVIGYLKREQEARGISDVRMAQILRVTTSAWAQIRRGERGLGLEILCRALSAFPGLLSVVVSFLGTLVSHQHTESAD